MHHTDMIKFIREVFPEKFNLGDDSLLYHYTTADVFDKLVEEGGELYCTHYMDLNDKVEFWKGFKYFSDYLVRKYGNEPKEEILELQTAMKSLKDVWRKLHKLYVDAPWIMSFTTERDSLSQWRSYTDHTNGGVSVGFEKNGLENVLQECREKNGAGWDVVLFPCIYYGSGVDERLDRLIDLLLERIDTNLSLWPEELNRTIYLLSSIIKDASFEMEHEWRLVIQATDKVALKGAQVIGGKARLPLGIGMKGERRVGGLMKEVLLSPHGNKNRLWHSVTLPKYSCDGLSYKLHSSSLSYNGK